MTTIKAIETQYKGYRFRSRLEARWAVFFDAVGIEWEYELEGYDLGELGWYLPDFWLPQAQFHAEVKPEKPEGVELDRLVYFDSHVPPPSFGVIFLIGIPAMWKDVAVKVADNKLAMLVDEPNSTWHVCSRCGVPNNRFAIMEAVDLARSARFEHGEKPAKVRMRSSMAADAPGWNAERDAFLYQSMASGATAAAHALVVRMSKDAVEDRIVYLKRIGAWNAESIQQRLVESRRVSQ